MSDLKSQYNERARPSVTRRARCNFAEYLYSVDNESAVDSFMDQQLDFERLLEEVLSPSLDFATLSEHERRQLFQTLKAMNLPLAEAFQCEVCEPNRAAFLFRKSARACFEFAAHVERLGTSDLAREVCEIARWIETTANEAEAGNGTGCTVPFGPW